MRVDFRADSLPLDVLPRFTDAVSNVNGRVVGVVAARGTPKHPTVVGEMGLDFATFHIVPLGVTFRELAGLVHMTGDKIVIDSIGGYSGGGTVGLRGTIGIADMSKPSFALRLGANDATVLDNETGMLHANADLKVDGPYTGVSITGTTRIVHGVIYIPETGGRKVISAGDPAVFNVVDTAVAASQGVVPGQNPLMQNLNVSVKLAVSRDTWVRSADANVEIYSTGPLTIHASPATGKLTLEGVVNTDRGTYTFMGRRFVLQRGSATFIGDPELNPLLQLAAEYEVQMAGRPALNINIIIGGTAHHPNISLTSDAQPPISQSDLLSYLAFGQPSSSLLSSQGNTGLTGQSTASGNLAGQAAALATKQLAGVAVGVLTKSFAASAGRSLGADVFNITPADLPTELSLNGVTTVLEGTQVEAGKYFTRQTFVLVQARPTFVAPGFTVQHRMGKGYRIEVSLEPRYLLRDPTLSTIQPTLTKESLGAFLIREWRF
jgi:translocation and assembly module TamB